MDRTSNQPQVKLSLLRSDSLKIRPHGSGRRTLGKKNICMNGLRIPPLGRWHGNRYKDDIIKPSYNNICMIGGWYVCTWEGHPPPGRGERRRWTRRSSWWWRCSPPSPLSLCGPVYRGRITKGKNAHTWRLIRSLSVAAWRLKVTVLRVLQHNGGFCNACTVKRSITLLCFPKQSMWQNGVVPELFHILNRYFNHIG